MEIVLEKITYIYLGGIAVGSLLGGFIALLRESLLFNDWKMETVVSNAISSTTDTVVNVLTTNIPTVMVVFAGLVGLGIALRLFKKLVGRKA